MCREDVNKKGWGEYKCWFFLAEKGDTTYAGAAQLIYTLLDLSLQFIPRSSLSIFFAFCILLPPSASQIDTYQFKYSSNKYAGLVCIFNRLLGRQLSQPEATTFLWQPKVLGQLILKGGRGLSCK